MTMTVVDRERQALAELQDRIRSEARLALHDCLRGRGNLTIGDIQATGRAIAREVVVDWRAAGLRQFWPVLALETRNSVRAFARILGFGHWQTAALARLTHTDAVRAAGLGARFNQGICIFDRLSDRADLRPALLAAFAPETLGSARLSHIASQAETPTPIRMLAALIVPIFSAIEGAAPEQRQTMAGLCRAMFEGQVAGLTPAPAADAWQAAFQKSALPFEFMAGLVALEAGADRQALLAAARTAGRITWILDDLCDFTEDLRDGATNRLTLISGEPADPAWTPRLRNAVHRECDRIAEAFDRIEAIDNSALLAEVMQIVALSWLAPAQGRG